MNGNSEVRSPGFSPHRVRHVDALRYIQHVLVSTPCGLKAARRNLSLVVVLLFSWSTNAASAPGLLQLFDGTSLHGTLESISTKDGVAWDFPAAQGPLVLRPDNISGIRFESVIS